MSPRAGLTADKVVATAAALADRDGPDAVTLARVAALLDVRTPSLYNHVGGLDDLRRRLTLRALDALGTRLQQAAVGRAGDDAIRAIAGAYRRFGHEHPGLYAATVPTTAVADEAVRSAGAAAVATVTSVLESYGLEGDTVMHAARGLRALVHGFVHLELAGGFGAPMPTDASFAWAVERFVAGLRAATPA